MVQDFSKYVCNFVECFPSQCLIETRCRIIQNLAVSVTGMKDQMLQLRADVWALRGRAQWWGKDPGFSIHFIGRCDRMKKRCLIVSGFVVVFKPGWLFMSTGTDIVDISPSFTLHQAGEINKGYSQRHKAMLLKQWSIWREEPMLWTRTVAVPGRWARLRCWTRTPLHTSSAMSEYLTYWVWNVQENTLFFPSPHSAR